MLHSQKKAEEHKYSEVNKNFHEFKHNFKCFMLTDARSTGIEVGFQTHIKPKGD
jgi:hypothetical protein